MPVIFLQVYFIGFQFPKPADIFCIRLFYRFGTYKKRTVVCVGFQRETQMLCCEMDCESSLDSILSGVWLYK